MLINVAKPPPVSYCILHFIDADVPVIIINHNITAIQRHIHAVIDA
jgi:hypothetical protein